LTKPFSLKEVEAIRGYSPKRSRFSDHPVVKPKDKDTYVVSTKFPCVDRLFKGETGLTTNSGPFGPYCFLSKPSDINKALEWQDQRKDFFFLRDNLTYSVAMDLNLASEGIYTTLGQAEHDAKADRSAKAVGVLADACARAFEILTPYQGADAICPVPPSPDKDWDLPTQIVERLSQKVGKPSLIGQVGFSKKKESVKALALEDKWKALEAAGFFASGKVAGKKIVLVDDKYQSGTTIQFVGSKLIEAGARYVFGLCPIKTWRDTDNK